MKILAAVMMMTAIVLGFISFNDVAENLGRPGGDHILGAVMLAAFACFLVLFLVGCILWVLSDISGQIAAAHKLATGPEAEKSLTKAMTQTALSAGLVALGFLR
jgi:hypothetical protein